MEFTDVNGNSLTWLKKQKNNLTLEKPVTYKSNKSSHLWHDSKYSIVNQNRYTGSGRKQVVTSIAKHLHKGLSSYTYSECQLLINASVGYWRPFPPSNTWYTAEAAIANSLEPSTGLYLKSFGIIL